MASLDPEGWAEALETWGSAEEGVEINSVWKEVVPKTVSESHGIDPFLVYMQ